MMSFLATVSLAVRLVSFALPYCAECTIALVLRYSETLEMPDLSTASSPPSSRASRRLR
jgi:hypothetical protein